MARRGGRGRVLAACVVALVLIRLLCLWPVFVERVYADGAGFWLGWALAFVSGFVPLSLAEWMVWGAVAGVVALIGSAVVRVSRRRERLLPALGGLILRLATVAAAVLLLFYVLWGIHYARRDLASRLEWRALPAAPSERQELEQLCRDLVRATNLAYEDVTNGRDLGRPTGLPKDARALDRDLDQGYSRLPALLRLPRSAGVSRGPAKPVLASVALSHLGLAGFYFPWTGEANYNRMVPACLLPHVIAHEKAHQRGFASEDEAQFLGFLACVSSDLSYARYSGWLSAQRTLLTELLRIDREAGRALLKERDPGVQRDVDAANAFWARYEGRAARVSLAVNDRYLKAQGVREGVGSYALSARLIVLFARSRGGSLASGTGFSLP